jgi:hypothetical protein
MDVLAERFWAKVDKNGPIIRQEIGACWMWTGATPRGGYGQLKITGSRKNLRSNRVAFFLEHGTFPVKTIQQIRAGKSWVRAKEGGALRFSA